MPGFRRNVEALCRKGLQYSAGMARIALGESARVYCLEDIDEQADLDRLSGLHDGFAVGLEEDFRPLFAHQTPGLLVP
jgi:hypothetical protein